MRNMLRKPIAKSIGVVKLIWPRHMVAIQLKNFTPVGTAIRKVITEKKGRKTLPVVNMWCAHTLKPRAPMPAVAKTNALYPKSGLRLKTGMISEMIPIPGNTMMYTAGWE